MGWSDVPPGVDDALEENSSELDLAEPSDDDFIGAKYLIDIRPQRWRWWFTYRWTSVWLWTKESGKWFLVAKFTKYTVAEAFAQQIAQEIKEATNAKTK